jgi:predicted DNA-binding transcriptional regulator YafY
MSETRFEKTVALIRLARVLAADSEGLTLDEMAEMSGVGRRTAERMRDAIEQAFGHLLETREDGRKVRFRMPARGLGNFFNAPTSTELTELEHAANAHQAAGDADRADILRSLQHKVRASLREAERRRLDTDIEAQLHAEALACQVGPRPLSDASVMTALRQALLAGRMVKFCYGNQDGTGLRGRNVVPYGLLFAPRYYLVAATKNRSEPALYRLDRIHDIEVTDEPGAPPEGFNLKAYASRSFGVFQEEPEDIIVSFDASAATDARAYLFHPTQSMTDETDGSLTVRFRAAGLLQIAHHLMTWGSTVKILEPENLKNMIWEQIEALHAHHRPIKKEVAEKGIMTS